MQDLGTQIEEKDRQITELNNASGGKDAKLSELQNDKSELLKEKQTIETNLTNANQQLTKLTDEIGTINNKLGQNVSEIDTIMDGLDKDTSDIDTHFKIMRSNIEELTKMINNGSNSNNDQVNGVNPMNRPRFGIPQPRPRPNEQTGGKHKTHKRRYKRTYKRTLKGGYVYNSSSKLDKASAVILTSSKDKSVKKKSKRQKT